MPAGWYADIEDARRLADELEVRKDMRAAAVVRRLLDELHKVRMGEPAPAPETPPDAPALEPHREG